MPEGYCNTGSPLVLSLTGEDLPRLTSAEDGVWFDLNRTGTRRLVAWTRPGDEVGWLAFDRNGNGNIDDGSELFGTSTSRPPGLPRGNGFDILADMDADFGAPDGKLDAADTIFASLRLWIDRNHNGQSEPGELLTMQQAGVHALYTDYRESRRRDRFGNQFKYVGAFELVNRRGKVRRERMYDVFLRIGTSGDTE